MRARSFTNGDRFGQVTVHRRYDPDDPSRTIIRCDCGTIKSVVASSVRSMRSCGCISADRSHGYAGTPTYNSWLNARARCEDPRDGGYHLYGGRGIKVCERWQDFRNFLADMGERPLGTSIDRINGDGDYEPGNCRWATAKQQAENIRPSLLDENGKRIGKKREWKGGDPMTLDEAMKKYGVSRSRLHQLVRERKNKEARATRKAERAARGCSTSEVAARDARVFLFGRRER